MKKSKKIILNCVVSIGAVFALAAFWPVLCPVPAIAEETVLFERDPEYVEPDLLPEDKQADIETQETYISDEVFYETTESEARPNLSQTTSKNLVNLEGQTYTLTVNVSGTYHGSVTINPLKETYQEGEIVTIQAIPKYAYNFVEWQGDASGSENPLVITITKDTVITAYFELKTFTLEVSQENCVVTKTPDQELYSYDTYITITIKPNPGFMLIGTSGTYTSYAHTFKFPIRQNHHITVTCAPMVYEYALEANTYCEKCVNFSLSAPELGESGITYSIKEIKRNGVVELVSNLRDFSFDTQTGTLAWYPHPNRLGDFVFTFEAQDTSNHKKTITVYVQVLTPPICRGTDAFARFMLNEAIDPQGYLDIEYRNSDGWHAPVDTSWSNQVERFTQYWGLQTFPGSAGKVTFANSSTAWVGLGGDNTAYGMVSAALTLYSRFTNPNTPLFGFYPGHYSDGRTGVEGHAGKFIYTFASIGSSGSELNDMSAYIKTAGAFRRDVFSLLKQKGALMPVIAMLDRLVRVNKDESRYMSAEAHPSFFGNTGLNALEMVKAANAMTIQTIPPIPKISLVTWPGYGTNGVSYFEQRTHSDEILFNTPMAIATLYRETQATTKVFVIDASGSFSPNDAAITEYNWVVIKGDPGHIRIIPLNADHSNVRIEIDYHGEAPVSYRTGVTSNLVEIALFVRNENGQLSPPAFFTSYSMRNEQRTIEGGRLTEVAYNSNVVPWKYPYLSPQYPFSRPKEWARDVYLYDADTGKCLGWDRYKPDGSVTSYTDDGYLIVARDAQGEPARVEEVQYAYDSAKACITATPLNGYNIHASAGIGGIISPDGLIAVASGGNKAFLITPYKGCEVEDVLVDGASIGAVGTHTFTNVSSDHTIEARFIVGDTFNYGDVDGNGDINAQDALAALKHSAGIVRLDDEARVRADVDGNGEVTAQDALLILQFSAGIISEFPVKT